MFKILETTATMRSLNLRAENHGDDKALACDIGLTFTIGNQILEMLQPGLLPSLYQGESAAGDDHLDLEDNFLPHRRFPLLGELSWDYEGAGYKLQIIDERLDGDDVITVHDCKVNKFKIDCKEGGSVELSVRVQANTDEETISELAHYLKSEVTVSLIPPEKAPDSQADIEDGEEEEPEVEAA